MVITNKDSSVDRQDFALHPQCKNNNITTRDYFAGLAMQCMLSVSDLDNFGDKYLGELISKDSYKMADKMIETRDKEKNNGKT